MTHRLYRRASRLLKRSGFTLVELLVVIAIIAILAGVALGPITAGIKKAQQSGAVQGARALALAEFQYAGDNNNTYPYSSTGLAATIAGMVPTYISDYSMLIVNGSPQSKYTGTTPSSMATGANGNTSYDLVYANGTPKSGLTSSAPDNTPVCFTGAQVALTSSSAGPLTIQLDPVGSPLGTTGMAVCYKSNSSKFLLAGTGTTTVTILDGTWDGTYPISSFGAW